jgi:hypothetical protein
MEARQMRFSNNIPSKPSPPSNTQWPSAREIAEALKGHRSGNGYVARCVCHEDRVPSLSVFDGTDKRGNPRPYVYCHAGCDWQDVQAELERRGLWPRYERRR